MLKIVLSLFFIAFRIHSQAQAGISADGKYVFITEDKTRDNSGNTLVIQSTTGSWKREIKDGYAAEFKNNGREFKYRLGNEEFVIELGTANQKRISNIENANQSSISISSLIPDSLLKDFRFSGEKVLETENSTLFYMQEKSIPIIPNDYVDVWSYLDAKNQDAQLRDAKIARKYAFCLNKKTSKFLRVTKENEKLGTSNGDFAIVYKFADDIFTYDRDGSVVESYSFVQYSWNKKTDCNVYLVSLKDGSRKLIKANVVPEDGKLPRYWLSPNGKYIVYAEGGSYYSYEISNGFTRRIATVDNDLNLLKVYSSSGLYLWVENDFLLIKDAYSDLWKVSITGKTSPVNITNGFFRKATTDPDKKVLRLMLLLQNANEIICRITCGNRYENDGIYMIHTDAVADPTPLIKMNGPYQYDYFQRADEKEIYLLRRQTATMPPKYYYTPDFKTFTPVTGDSIDRRPAGILTEVLTWKTADGNINQGVLYKPRDFESTKKYPIVFVYYETKNQPHNFYMTYGSGDLVDYGYLVFSADIYYTIGETGKSALNAVVSAAKLLSKKTYVDSKRMGLRGGSFGGYETNYIVSHTNLFAAAISGCGYSDFISVIGSLDLGPRPHSLEGGSSQNRLGVTLWDRPDIWIKNSPLFYADRVTTPLLIVHSMTDDNVPFEQNVAFFKALRYLGKKVWMLQYDNAGHIGGNFSKSIVGINDGNCDMCTRQLQFFNHYLKGEIAPKWMVKGIPARMKGIEKGFESDSTEKKPGPGLRREKPILSQQQHELLQHRTMVTNDGKIIEIMDK